MKSNWEHSHSGVFTRDLENTVNYYRSLGIAEAPPPQVQPREGHKAVNIEFGQEISFGGDTRRPFLQLIYIGNLELEVLRAPLQRPKGEALAYGEGCNHVCFNVPDIDGETEVLVKKGFRVIQDFRLDDVRLEDYLDTREYGNILLSMRPLQGETVKAKKARYGIVDWRFVGHSAVVKDLDRTISYYRTMGIASFKPPAMFDSKQIDGLEVYGKAPRGTVTARTRSMQIGPVLYELVQPLEGPSLYRESLERRGEGIIDLTFAVTDLKREISRLTARGVPVVFSGRPQKGRPFAFFDTRKDGGDVMLKLIQS